MKCKLCEFTTEATEANEAIEELKAHFIQTHRGMYNRITEVLDAEYELKLRRLQREG